MAFKLKIGESVDTPVQFKVIKLLSEGKNDEAFNIYRGNSERDYVNAYESYIKLLKEKSEIYDKYPAFKKRIFDFASHLHKISNDQIFEALPHAKFEIVVDDSPFTNPRITLFNQANEYHNSKKNIFSNLKPAAHKNIYDKLYDVILKNDSDSPTAYFFLKSLGTRSQKTGQSLRAFINKKNHYKPAHPLYFKSVKKDNLLSEIQKTFKGIAYLHNLDKVFTHKEQLEGIEAYKKYLDEVDGQTKAFLTKHRNIFFDEKMNLKTDLSEDQIKQVAKMIQTRQVNLGLPKMSLDITKVPKKDRKGFYYNLLKDEDFNKISDIFHTSSLEDPQTEIQKRKEIERVKAEVEKGSPEGVEVHLTGDTPTMFVSKQFKENAESEAAKLIATPKGEIKLEIKETKAQPNYNIESVKHIINSVVQKNRQLKIIDELSKDQAFRASSTPDRIHKIKTKFSKKPYIKTELQTAFNEIKKHGPSLGQLINLKGSLTPTNVNKAIQKIPILSDEDQSSLSDFIKYFNDDIKKSIETDFNSESSKIVHAPMDIRGLPPGVKMRPVDPKEELEKTQDAQIKVLDAREEIKTKTKAFNEAKTQDEKRQLLTEINEAKETLASENIKIKSKKKQDAAKTSAAKRVGAIRPHFKNPTEKNVQEAIGETPEQQILDFKNWHVFDYPEDQTGQGTSKTNPLIKQNDARTSFNGKGSIFDEFNESYDITEGIFERKDFYKERSRLTKPGVARGLNKAKVLSEEAQFLQKFNKDNNGLFNTDQTKKEQNKFYDIYQTPANFFEGTLYPLSETTNSSIFVSDFTKNLKYFIQP